MSEFDMDNNITKGLVIDYTSYLTNVNIMRLVNYFLATLMETYAIRV